MKDLKPILKANLLSIICGVVVIVALVVPVWPMGAYKKDLEARLQERVGVYNALNSVHTKSRTLPAIDPDNATPVTLEGFPNDNIIAKADAVKTSFEAQSKQLVDKAIELNHHDPLVTGALPFPVNNAVAINFRDRYRRLLLFTVPPQGQGPIVKSGIATAWKVGLPPTQQDIANAIQKLWQTKYQPQLGTSPAGTAVDRAKQAFLQEFKDESALIPDQERTKVAMDSLLYMNPDALPYIPSFNNKEAPQPLDIWNAQVQLWVIDDVGRGIAAANAGAKNVTESPLKHLVKLTIPYPNPYIVMAGQTMEGELTGAAPKVLDLAAAGATSPVPMTTGRVSNPLYDVVHFDLVINVEASKIPHVLSSLSSNRFLTVLTASVLAVDSSALQQQGFMYGDKPIVQLTLRCEDLFFHKWERPLMPKVMADAMAGVQPAQGGEGANF